MKWWIQQFKWKGPVQEVPPSQDQSNLEHGVGMVKKEYLVEELGLETVETMRRIKVILLNISTNNSSPWIRWNF
jgi:hypothetical protein